MKSKKKQFHNRFHSFFKAISPEAMEQLKKIPRHKRILEEHSRFCDYCIEEKLSALPPNQRKFYEKLGRIIAASAERLQKRKEKAGTS